MIHRDVDNAMLEVLGRSVIGETLAPIDLELVDTELRQLLCAISCIRAMGSYKALITFSNKAKMEEALEE